MKKHCWHFDGHASDGSFQRICCRCGRHDLVDANSVKAVRYFEHGPFVPGADANGYKSIAGQDDTECSS